MTFQRLYIITVITSHNKLTFTEYLLNTRLHGKCLLHMGTLMPFSKCFPVEGPLPGNTPPVLLHPTFLLLGDTLGMLHWAPAPAQ